MNPVIIFEDENFLAVSKPAGVIVNNADTSQGVETLQDWVEKTYPIANISSSDEFMVDGYDKAKEFRDRGGIVHRLDKETSGIILIAKKVPAFMELQKQFKNGIVKKTYQTVVHGKIENPTGVINAPIGRLPWNRMRFGVLPEGREAETHYKVLEYKQFHGEPLTLVEVYPKTGRTHQIRVHFQHINYPVFADALYAGRKQGRDDRKVLPRHFLHASKMSLNNPVTNQPMELEDEWSSDLKNFYESLNPVSS